MAGNADNKSYLNPGVFSAEQLLKKFGHRTAIVRLVRENRLISLGAGYYATPNLDPFVAQIHVVARFYPKAVISGISALVIHGLCDERLDKVTVDIPKGTRVRNNLIDAKRVALSRLIGVTRMAYFGKQIKIYNIERTLCDAYRVDRGELFFKALKSYVEKYKPDPEKIAAYDKALGTRVLSSLQQELAVG